MKKLRKIKEEWGYCFKDKNFTTQGQSLFSFSKPGLCIPSKEYVKSINKTLQSFKNSERKGIQIELLLS